MNVYVVGAGMTPFGKLLDQSVKDLTRTAVNAAIADAGCTVRDIQGAFVANTTQGWFEGQTFIAGPIALRAMGIHGIPMLTVENACASGSTAFWQAVNFIRAGAGDVALAVGVEKMNVADKGKIFSLFDSGWDIYAVEATLTALRRGAEGFEVPEGSESDGPYSVFMEVYANFARKHMQRYGLTQRQIAAVSAKNHQHSVHNERAHFRRPFSVEEVLAAKPIVYPLTIPMCAPVTDGGAAAIVCGEQALSRYGFDRKRAIRVLHTEIASGRDDLREGSGENSITHTVGKVYEAAGLGPGDMSVAEVHDATAVGEILQMENLGLCPVGEGGLCAERGDTQIGGRIPINPSGGLESKGHPLGATGLGQIFELVAQLRGECGSRQVENARFAIQENGGGLIGTEEAVFAITILGKD